MHRILLVVVFILFSGTGIAQTDSLETPFAFRINEYMLKINDTTTVVQVSLPDAAPFKINKEQFAVLKYRYGDEHFGDTSLIGWGRCHLIKSSYFYFGILHKKLRVPRQGDLLYTTIKVPIVYKGLLFFTGARAINFTKVDESQFFYGIEIFSMSENRESEILNAMAEDIRYTGKAMLGQSPDQNQIIKGGLFNGKQLFDAMQQITSDDVRKFLKYVIARPDKYAGNTWKISETIATWMVSESPTVYKK